MIDLRRNFTDRDDLLNYLREQFPAATQPDNISDTRGGRQAALNRLTNAKIDRYDRTRNFLDGDITRLSPYLRHGVLSLSEVRDHFLDRNAPEKLINELGWRDFWQRAYANIGDNIWDDAEQWKTGFTADDYADTLPDDIRNATTGTCMDIFIQELYDTGYLHNHARMWLAAYVVHWRRIKWQAGARWFLEHLLDGDLASNNLSWQWVASTYSHKPYFMNADNIRKFAKGQHPHLLNRKLPPFEGTYPQLEAQLFPNKPPEVRQNKPKSNRNRRGK